MSANSIKKILLVDDDDLLRSIYSSKLQEDGFEVIMKKNGREALESLENGKIPDLIFTGIIMPEMTGFDLIAKIRSFPNLSHIPIIISSHRGLPEDKKRAQDLGIRDFIIQGETTPNEMARRVRFVLGIIDVLKISFSPDHFDGKELIDLLNKQQGTYFDPSVSRELVLEFKAEKEPGLFRIKLVE